MEDYFKKSKSLITSDLGENRIINLLSKLKISTLKALIVAILFLCFSPHVIAQKYKDYGDLFMVISTRVDLGVDVITFLQDYIKDHDDNAHAYLTLGKAYHEIAAKTLVQEEQILFLNDALVNYNQALSKLSVRQLALNDFFFRDYARRDLRTGKYGVKYEDVVLDINGRRSDVTTQQLNLCRADPESITSQLSEEVDETNLNSRGKYYALVIGISKYDNYKLNLIRPDMDARKFARIIQSQYSFDSANVFVLLNPTREVILNQLFEFRKKLTKSDNLLIFYAGHGMYDEDAEQGYWWPADADSENPSKWLSNSDMRDQIRGIKTAHTLLIADACFSGAIFRSRGGEEIGKAGLDIISLYRLASRRAITSGTMTTVPDQSIFFNYLVKALTSNQNKYLTSQMLFDSFRQPVINNTLTVPQDGVISETGDMGGDFIFIRK